MPSTRSSLAKSGYLRQFRLDWNGLPLLAKDKGLCSSTAKAGWHVIHIDRIDRFRYALLRFSKVSERVRIECIAFERRIDLSL